MQCSPSDNSRHYKIPQNAHFPRITPQIWGIANTANSLKYSCFLSISPIYHFFSRPYISYLNFSSDTFVEQMYSFIVLGCFKSGVYPNITLNNNLECASSEINWGNAMKNFVRRTFIRILNFILIVLQYPPELGEALYPFSES